MAESYSMSVPETWKVAIRQSTVNENAGRGLFATKSFNPGDVIFDNADPLAIVPSVEMFQLVCAYCYGVPAIPKDMLPASVMVEEDPHEKQLRKCAGCLSVSYCSKECQTKGWTEAFHKLECRVYQKFRSNPALGKIHSPLRVIAHIALRYKASGADWKPWKDFNTLAYKSLDECRPGLAQRAKLYTAAIGLFAKTSLEPQIIEKLVLRVFLNSHTVIPNAIGSCLDPLLAMINHSCRPNAMIRFAGRKLSVSPLRLIKKDEEITVGYTSDLLSRDVRQKSLRDTYFFNCRCESCASPEELLTEEMEARKKEALKNFPTDGIDMFAAFNFSGWEDFEKLLNAQRCLGPDWPVQVEPMPTYLTLQALGSARFGLWSGRFGFVQNMGDLVLGVLPRIYGVDNLLDPNRLTHLFNLFAASLICVNTKPPVKEEDEKEVTETLAFMISDLKKHAPVVFGEDTLMTKNIIRQYENLLEETPSKYHDLFVAPHKIVS